MVAYYCSERVLCHPQNGGKFKFCLACLTNFRERFLPGQPVGDTEVSAWIAWSDSKFENSSSVRWLIIENIVCTPSGGPILPFMQISSHFEHCKYVFWIRTGFEAWWDPRETYLIRCGTTHSALEVHDVQWALIAHPRSICYTYIFTL